MFGLVPDGLVMEADSAQEVFKARVRPERIEARSDQHARVEPLVVAFFEPIHSLIGISERCMDCRNLRSIRLEGARALLQIAQQSYRLGPVA